MAEDKLTGKKVASGLLWAFAERIGAQTVSFVISILLARMLLPKEYGVVSLVMVFINLANVFISNGLGESLVQKQDADEVDFSSIFYCGLTISVVLYAVLFCSAPTIADFYDNEMLRPVLRVLALVLPITAVNSVQNAYVSRNMIFKKFFVSTLAGTIGSGVIGVIMAFTGFGPWALVAQYCSNALFRTISLFVVLPWRPRLLFSWARAKGLLRYGSRIMGAEFINSGYSQLRSLIIGKVYSSEQLAYYQKGNSFPSLVITNINTAVSKVLFPSMTKLNHDPEQLKQFTRKSMRLTSYVIFPLMAGLIAVAEPMILFLLTEKWIQAVKLLQILCLYWIFQPVLTANWQVIKARGRSDLCLKLELLKKGVGVVLVIGSMYISVEALAWSNVLLAGFSVLVNMFPCRKLIGYTMLEQTMDLLPAISLSLVMCIVTHLLGWLAMPVLPVFAVLVLQVVVGAGIYIGLSALLRVECFRDCMNILSGYRKRSKE